MMFNATFNYIEAANFIGGGNESTRRKPQAHTCDKSLTYFIT
jgi:hypothetical protein